MEQELYAAPVSAQIKVRFSDSKIEPQMKALDPGFNVREYFRESENRRATAAKNWTVLCKAAPSLRRRELLRPRVVSHMFHRERARTAG